MQCIKTDLSEKAFKQRLSDLTMAHTWFDRGYKDRDVFVLKVNKNCFRIGYHVKKVGRYGRYDGYRMPFLYGKYSVDADGKISVRYWFGQPFLFLLPSFLMDVLCVPIFLYMLYDLFIHQFAQPIMAYIIVGILSVLGIWTTLCPSKKNRVFLVQHLNRICKIKA